MYTNVQFFDKNCLERICKLKFIKTDGWLYNDWNIYFVMIFFFVFFYKLFFLLKTISNENAIPKTVFPYNCYQLPSVNDAANAKCLFKRSK